MIEPRIELGTLCVLSICHNQLDHPTTYEKQTLFDVFKVCQSRDLRPLLLKK